MKLARAAARTWRTHRDALRAIAGDEREPSRLLLTGGSVLNADWGHRESIDIDVLLPDRRNVDELGAGRRLDLAAAVSGEIEVEGATETVLSSAQILRRKLERIKKALPRDAGTASGPSPGVPRPGSSSIRIEGRAPAARQVVGRTLRPSPPSGPDAVGTPPLAASWAIGTTG